MSHHTTSGTRKRSQARTRVPDRARITIKGGWTAIPNRLLKDKRLSRDARLLGCIVFMHAANNGRAFPSQEELADELGQTSESDDGSTTERTVTVRSIQRWLGELRKTGWLEWRQTLRNNEYTLLDPSEASYDAESDSSLNTALTGATQESSRATEGSPSKATERSPRATQESRSTTTQRSDPKATGRSGNTTQGSPDTTQESCSSFIDSRKDSNIDSSSSEDPPTHPDGDDDPVVRFLEQLGITAAQEFAGLDLAAVQERVTQLQRDPNCRPGAIVKSLRAAPPQRATERGGPLDPGRYTSGAYAGLFRRGGDVSDLDEQ